MQGVTTALGMSLISRLGETALARLRELFVERALSLPLDRVEKAGSGDLNSRVTRDVSRVADAVRGALPELARSALSIVLTLGALALLDWRFLLAALIAVPVQSHTARWYVRNAVPLYAKERIATGTQQQQLLDTIGGARTVRAYRLQKDHSRRVTERSRSAVELTMSGVQLMLRFYSLACTSPSTWGCPPCSSPGSCWCATVPPRSVRPPRPPCTSPVSSARSIPRWCCSTTPSRQRPGWHGSSGSWTNPRR